MKHPSLLRICLRQGLHMIPLASRNAFSQNSPSICSPLRFGHEKIKHRRKGHGAYQSTSLRLLELHTLIRSEYRHHFLAIAVAAFHFFNASLATDIRGVEQTLYSWNVIGGALQTI